MLEHLAIFGNQFAILENEAWIDFRQAVGQHDIGKPPGRERTELVVHPERTRGIKGCHLDRLNRIDAHFGAQRNDPVHMPLGQQAIDRNIVRAQLEILGGPLALDDRAQHDLDHLAAADAEFDLRLQAVTDAFLDVALVPNIVVGEGADRRHVVQHHVRQRGHAPMRVHETALGAPQGRFAKIVVIADAIGQVRELAQADHRIHLQQRIGDRHRSFLPGSKGKHPIRQALVVLEQLLSGLHRLGARRAHEIEAFGENGGRAAGHDRFGECGRVGQLRIEVNVGIDQPRNGVQTFAVKNLTHLDRRLVRIQCDDALVVDQNGSLIDRFAVDIEDIQVFQQKVGFFLSVENIENRLHLIVVGSNLVSLPGCRGISFADFLVHGLSHFRQWT